MSESKYSLNTSIKYLKGVGPKKMQAFNNSSIYSVNDLLNYYPRRYLDRSTVKLIKDIKIHESVTIIGNIEVCGIRRTRKRSLFEAILSDGTGFVKLIWFNGAKYIKNLIKKNDRLAVHGKIEFFNGYQILHPDYDKIDTDIDPINTGSIVGLYPLTNEFKKVKIEHRFFRRLMKETQQYIDKIDDYYDSQFLVNEKLISLKKAIKNIHFPNSPNNLERSINRLKFDEHFFLQLLMVLRRDSLKTIHTKPYKIGGNKGKKIIDKLGFELTNAQIKVINEINNDISGDSAMNRLLQGDVGSGKTIVAILTAIVAVENNMQVAIMAPTEILANQHYQSFTKILDMVQISCALIIGKQPKKERKNILTALKDGKINIIIGTHALIQKKVEFKDLGLIVVDEQHRFGVLQRGNLISKGVQPHVLVMTATPIPRTMAITYHGDMNLSIIDEMPKNRKKIITKIVDDKRLLKVYDFMKQEISSGRQCIIVYPLVEETEKSDLAAATDGFKKLKNVFKNINLGLIHGKMKKAEKDLIMSKFVNNTIHILVSTTVIEVGIDIPNASVIVIEHSERFGLTQLHQLRGRVGRGAAKSYCILVERKITQNSKKRLQVMEYTSDGFIIADEDLKMRGPGKFFSTEQSGFFNYKLADMINDGELIRKARNCAQKIVDKDPKLKNHILMKERLIKDYSQYFDTIQIT